MNSSNNKRRVLLVNNSVYLPGEGGYKRTMYMFDEMKMKGYPVTLVTGDFNHYKKQARDIDNFRRTFPNYNDIVFLHMPSYKRNISIKRYFSEKCWSRHFKKWFSKNASNYDVVFFSDADYILPVNKICDRFGIKKIIDIRDLRPEAFHVVVKNDLLYKFLFYPMKLKVDRAYSCADELVAVSKEYLERGLQANNNSKHPLVVYIGSTFNRFYSGIEKYSGLIDKPSNEFWVIYTGTIGGSYDLETVIRSAKRIQERGYNEIRFKILGQGPDEQRLVNLCNALKISNVDFLGFFPYEKMAAFLSKSDLTINALKKTASQSIINKVGDYLAAGIPMINGSSCKEQNDMVEYYKIGLNYEPENADSLETAILTLRNDLDKRCFMGTNAKKLAQSLFDRNVSYQAIYKLIDIV